MSTIGQEIGLFVIPLVLGLGLFNGVVMLVSPARWFTLSRNLAFRGTLNQRDYTSTTLGRIQIRGLGLILAGLTSWMIGSFFGITYDSPGPGHKSGGVPFNWWLYIATCVGALVYGFIMLLRPRWWIAKYFKEYSDQEATEPWLGRFIRFVGAVVIVIGFYLLLQRPTL